MQTLLVLGIIPGTNIQINFQTWLLMLTLIVMAACRTYLQNRDNHDILLTAAEVQLHASALHSRITRAIRPLA